MRDKNYYLNEDPQVRETMVGFQAALYGNRVRYGEGIPVRPIVVFRTIVDPALKDMFESKNKGESK